jgi:hypothetical protein
MWAAEAAGDGVRLDLALWCLDFMVKGDAIRHDVDVPDWVAETVIEDAQLKPFSDIQEIWKDDLTKYEDR